ncbi:butyrophilin-like protein 3 [Orycteropus afer afer]|uniref:Butyrophilin-like protein 3 n=1 Tax=Orycteropus afer afer TaxID=1230840 RepID=A0A8B7B1E7_ORYAF|nr:butyrophilin-like protein 3 [Orycteropus afer afer]
MRAEWKCQYEQETTITNKILFHAKEEPSGIGMAWCESSKFSVGQWEVIGPDKPVQALVGKDVVFSCFLYPELTAEAMEVRFFRNRFSDVVHIYKDGKDQKHMQMPSYHGRTELIKDSITKGHVSLRLENVTSSDADLYGCSFISQNNYQEAIWELQVSGLGSTPLVSIMGYVDGGIQLLCQSSGWLPQPTVKWKGPQGQDLPSESKITADRHGMFYVETSFTVKENTGSISCSIQHIDQSLEVQSSVWIGETFFQPSPWSLVSILLILACIGICGVVSGVRIFYFKCQRKLLKELKWRRMEEQAELREARTHAVEVTLDPDTAHPQLRISDLKTVTHSVAPQKMPDSEKRFIGMKCVVASQGFSAGKHYWEVGVGHEKGWQLGVCRDDTNRSIPLFSQNGFWVFGLTEQHEYFTLNPHRITLFPSTKPTKVGIFLDYKGGTISFFNIDDQSHIYTLTHQFESLLRPCIMCWDRHMENPIVICPVHQKENSFSEVANTQTQTMESPLDK